MANAFKILGVLLFFLIFTVMGFGSGFLPVALGVGVGLGFIVGFIPFAMGNSIKMKAMAEYGSPFFQREKEYLLLSEELVEFGFSNRNNRYVNSMDIYSIRIDDITAVNINGPVLTIIGRGRLLSYDDITTKRISFGNSQRVFYPDSHYSILLAFKERDDILEYLQNFVTITVTS